MKEYVKHIPRSEAAVLAADHTAWLRLYAKTLQEHSFTGLFLNGLFPNKWKLGLT